MMDNQFIQHYLKDHLNGGGFVTICWVGLREIMTAIVFACSSTRHKIVKCLGHLLQVFSTKIGDFPVQGKCKRQVWTIALQGGFSFNLQTRTDEMQNVKSLTVIRWRNEQKTSITRGQQSNTCNWSDCVLSVEGDKSKSGIAFFFSSFSFYDCNSKQVGSPFSRTRYRPRISVYASKK